ncbi:hypothetical protein MNBD_GAMMA24-1132 [hydrothermal vent metagenome]|uniref:RDD domain-containing protein n=1 Tax=hydrothermal vent metagenome TaxID=652676 RepID=A0A3B1BFR2_9ZZZZ
MNTTAELKYAGFWRRLLAFFIDYLLLFALLTPLLYLIYGRGYFLWLSASEGFFEIYGTADLLLAKILPFLLLVIFWQRLGATPGKILLDCRLVDARTLNNISYKSAVIRAAGYIISALPVYLGFIWIAFDKRKQGLHDKLAGTLVLHDPDDYAYLSLQQLMDRCE